MRILHLADLHLKPETYALAEASIDTCIKEHSRNPFAAVLLAGDIWHGAIQDSERSRFNDFLALIRALADRAPVAMIYGYRHDVPGSLEVFESLNAAHPIRILRPGKAYGLTHLGKCIYDMGEQTLVDDFPELLLFGVPEPTKEWLLAEAGATGKAASDEQVRAALSGLLLGLGGMRRQFPNLPCIILYHGDVYGATTAVGYSTARGTEMSVSRDDLAAVGADYYALGHIHLPQQIKGLPAYYPGKIYADDWNEVGYKPGANVVELKQDPIDGVFRADVSRLDFPHPERKKIFTSWPIGLDAFEPDGNVKGRMVWIDVTSSRELAADFDEDASLQKLIASGALTGSKITLSIPPVETVRAVEIAEKKSLRDKAAVWGEASSVQLPETVLAKADAVEMVVGKLDQLSGPPKRFRNVSTRIRGSRGLYRKQRKDEAFIDWQGLGEGVVAYVGPNGYGKTTSFDFSKPWPVPVSRRPKTLKAHFRLRDSAIENVYLEEVSGVRYRTLINIDGATKSGGCEYFLYRDSGAGWEPVEGVVGKQDPFVRAIDEIFGPLEIYLRTSYVPQKPSTDYPDISEATQGEKKALIAALAGKDYAPYQLHVTDKRKALESAIVILDATIAAQAGVGDEIVELILQIDEAGKEAERKAQEALGVKTRGQALAAEVDTLNQIVAEFSRKAEKKTALETEIAGLITQSESADREIEGYSAAVLKRDAAAKELARIKELEDELSTLSQAKAEIDKQNHEALIAHDLERRKLDTDRQYAQGKLDEKRRELGAIERDLAREQAKLSAPIKDHCPTCAQLLPEAARAHLIEERDKLAEVVKDLEAKKANAEFAERSAKEILEAIVYPEAPKPIQFSEASRVEVLATQLAFVDPESERETIRKADEAAIRIEAAEQRKETARDRIAKATIEAADLRDEIEDGEPQRILATTKAEELTKAREDYTRAASEESAARSRANTARESLEKAEARRAEREKASADRVEKAGELEEWRQLERVIDGVRDLELDALAPSIAEIATRILKSAGDTGRIKIETTRLSSGSAKKAKQIEDFLIFYVAEDGEEQDIGTCSGGEMVWARKALYDAFAVIRSRNAGIRFTTGFLDETDGALHPSRKADYYHMLEAAHEESGRYQTILITQSAEIAAMAPRVLDVTKLGPKEANTGELALGQTAA